MMRKKKARGRKPYRETMSTLRLRLDKLLADDRALENQQDFLLLAGHLLFGVTWQAEMARLLGKEHKFIARCMQAKPDARLSPEHRDQIQKALWVRHDNIARHLDRFSSRPDPADAELRPDWAA
jgi:hypothetical protein